MQRPPTFSFCDSGTVELECDVWDLEEYLKSDGSFGLVFEDNCGIPELEQDFEIVEEPDMFRRKIVHLDFYLNRCLWQAHSHRFHTRRKCCGHDRPRNHFYTHCIGGF